MVIKRDTGMLTRSASTIISTNGLIVNLLHSYSLKNICQNPPVNTPSLLPALFFLLQAAVIL